MTLFITKRLYFSCAHRIQPHPIYDPLTFVGHHSSQIYGSNYNLFVTVSNPIDPKSGMVYPLSELKFSILRLLDKSFDHFDLDYANTHSAIAERLFHSISEIMATKSLTMKRVTLVNELGEGAEFGPDRSLSFLTLGEFGNFRIYAPSQNNLPNLKLATEVQDQVLDGNYEGAIQSIKNDNPDAQITLRANRSEGGFFGQKNHHHLIDFWFSYPHQLFNHNLSRDENWSNYGHCVNLHGHNFRLRTILNSSFFAADHRHRNFTDLNKTLHEMSSDFDKAFVGELGTCENLLQNLIFNGLQKVFGDQLLSVELRETANNFISKAANNVTLTPYSN